MRRHSLQNILKLLIRVRVSNLPLRAFDLNIRTSVFISQVSFYALFIYTLSLLIGIIKVINLNPCVSASLWKFLYCFPP